MNNLTEFEQDVITKLLEGEDEVLNYLRAMFQLLVVESREFTGAGFFLNFSCSEEKTDLYEKLDIKPWFCFGDVEAQVDFLKYGAGFLLWVEDGQLTTLEGYTYDETWPKSNEIANYKLSYIYEKRNFKKLKATWKL